MQLTGREEYVVEAFRRLPPAAAEESSALAGRLAGLAATTNVKCPDWWSDDDLREFTAGSLRRLEEEESDNC